MSQRADWRQPANTPERQNESRTPGGGGVCHYFNQPRGCPRGVTCPFLHVNADGEVVNAAERPPPRPEPTAEEEAARQEARRKYNAWKRHIKNEPRANDIKTIEMLWQGALKILNAEDRDSKQSLARDLDDQNLHGRKHMQSLLGMVTHDDGASTFVKLVRPFLLTITHPDLLDCLAVDTAVGAVYNFITGNNGTRAIPFLQALVRNLSTLKDESDTAATTLLETFTAAVISLREILRREQRAIFNEDLPQLVEDFEEFAEAFKAIDDSVTYRTSSEPKVNGVSTSAVVSSYPRAIELPGGRHDNDKLDIAEIQILPTADEIKSDIKEYLPSTNRDQPHPLSDPVQRHIDTHFRLYRHDIFGALKDDIGGFMLAVEKNPALLDNPRLSIGDIRSSYIFHNANITDIKLHRRRGLEASITFTQPPPLRNSTGADRRKWWEETRRLSIGILLCYVSFDGNNTSLLFFVVSERGTSTGENKGGLASHPELATITATLATRRQTDFESMTQLRCEPTKGLLIELPSVIPGTFIPILENLQNMQQQSRLPFRHWILPEEANDAEPLAIPPPVYAQEKGFEFSLKPLLNNPDDDFWIDPSLADIYDEFIIDEIAGRTELDRGQCVALVAALTREFAFIQGPPGTGKSYLGVALMKVLLACAECADLGPILVVCFTNHALDQFLEHLDAIGVEKIIRVGGKSKSDVLKGKNLKIVSRDERRTKSEGYGLWTNNKKLDEGVEAIQEHCDALRTCMDPSWANLSDYLAENYPLIHAQFSRVDDEGFQLVGRHPFDNWRSAGARLPTSEFVELDIEVLLVQAEEEVHGVPPPYRTRLVDWWISNLRQNITDDLFEAVKESEETRQEMANIHEEVDRRVLSTAQVIGVTTTGLAGRISTLRHVNCKVLICEEAGEIMEPHMLSALIPSVEHVISIGDHQQLRPKIINYNLSLESSSGAPFQLDRSQFERLSVGESGRKPVPVAQLNVQRRMRPDVSRLIREIIYPKLVDHETTKSLPNVVGLRDNVFWLDHTNGEDDNRDDSMVKSHSNEWEVDMTHALLKHIIRQGVYKSDEIAVLTPYTGQLQKLRSKFRREFEVVLSDLDQDSLEKDGLLDLDTGVDTSLVIKKPLEKKQMIQLLRLATVDNFQGEEAKVIIVSLVRSNKRRDPGFLKTTNRINVLLSRAQHGLYLIGNSDTMINATMWKSVVGLLEDKYAIGPALSLCCPRHMDTELEASTPDDFAR
ncbi:NFX1-type zinc finger-containing protein [Lachnellula suecica]|uniref:NFX1-type zinc finger-containing protein n=1 Tax=Lachnellula suecica TaxID=602035 RepID=A0A8T9CC27_9HELO|nr:NFX1-type zinc finger-containing protein [Lachnellula suecica]